jgi:succinate dehydrogenase/fumarate reductase flavoprotein subunit
MQKISELEREVLAGMSIPEISESNSYGAYPLEVQDALEVRMMVPLARLVLSSALFREETRGHHLRTDYPDSAKEPKHTFLMEGKDPWQGEVNRERQRWEG